MLVLRDDLEPLLDTDVTFADIVRLSRDRRLVLNVDDGVVRSTAWQAAMTSDGT